jgi:hypothetical protein
MMIWKKNNYKIEIYIYINNISITKYLLNFKIMAKNIEFEIKGNVYIASMNMRREWAKKPNDNIISVNVTSAQSKNSQNRLAFSPMTEIIGGYKGYRNFESYWQSAKVFKGLSHEKCKTWWRELKVPKRRYPGAKGLTVLCARFDDIDEDLDYISSRKRVYVPEYFDLIKNKETLLYWKQKVDEGFDVVIYDFDGPREHNGNVTCKEVSEKLLIDKINDTRFPFGHGYIIAAYLAGITLKDYIM